MVPEHPADMKSGELYPFGYNSPSAFIRLCSGIAIFRQFDNRKTETPFCVLDSSLFVEIGTRS